jgi:hypothetical protein
MPYTAQSQSLFGAPGAPTPPRNPIDVAGAVDALTSGATSLIHGAMLRRNTENEIAYRNNELALQKQREQRETDAQQAQLAQQALGERHRFIEAGGIPAHTSTTPVAGTAPIAALNPLQPTPTAPQPSRIGSAMTSGLPSVGAMPGVQVTPASAPETGAPAASTATVYHPENTETPESYDPARGASYARGMMMQQLRNEGWTTRDAARGEVQNELLEKRLKAQQDGREFMAQKKEGLVKLKAALDQAKTGTARAMSGNQMEKSRQQAAEGLLDKVGGSYDEAKNLLDNTEQGQALRKLGVEERHLMYAHSKLTTASTGQAVRLQTGPDGKKPTEAVRAIEDTRRLVGGGSRAGAGNSGGPTAPGGDDFTDDEIADAMKAGKTKPDDLRSYVTQQRSKKAPK